MGGYASRGTSPQTVTLQDLVPIRGIFAYKIQAGRWENDSATSYSIYGTAIYGQLPFVPSFAIEGLLIVVGGVVARELIVALIWFLMRCQWRSPSPTQESHQITEHKSLDSEVELKGKTSRPEYVPNSQALAQLEQPW